MRDLRIGLAVAVAAALLGTSAHSREGASAFILGAEDTMSGALPPASGFYLLNYAGHYQGELQDANGNGTGINVSATFEAPRFVYMSDLKFGGLQYGAAVILPMVHQSFSLPAGAPGPSERSVAGFGNPIVTPLILAGHSKNFHWATGLDVFVPLGTYDKNNPFKSIGALLHKSGEGRASPFPGRIYPTASVTGTPRAV